MGVPQSYAESAGLRTPRSCELGKRRWLSASELSFVQETTRRARMLVEALSVYGQRKLHYVQASERRACVRARRAYKLGKRRWSYNQCELRFVQEGGTARAEVMEAGQYATASLSEEQAESGVTYQVRLQRMEGRDSGCRGVPSADTAEERVPSRVAKRRCAPGWKLTLRTCLAVGPAWCRHICLVCT